MRRVVVLLAVLALAGCGASAAPKHSAQSRAHARPSAPADPNADLRLPAHVPRRARGAADRASVHVIARWLRALRSGDEYRAARFWATGAKFQNATPVLTIDTPI